jgi:predicted branched-subunit amino acid permease
MLNLKTNSNKTRDVSRGAVGVRFFNQGFRAMLPITTGIIPFGAVMGTVCADAKLSLFQTVGMNVLVFAGAAQLAAIDLLKDNAEGIVIVTTGLIINLRFLLYSAAMSPVVQKSGFFVKLFTSYLLTDQTYAVMSANEKKFGSNDEALIFYFGSCLCMTIAWHLSVVAGFAFGNFAPTSLALDYAVPLSFIALVIPTLKNKTYVWVALFSSVVSLLLSPLPYKLGLIATTVLAIGLGAILTRKKAAK